MNVRLICLFSFLLGSLSAQAAESVTLLKADRVFDGVSMHTHWLIAVEGEKIIYAGDADALPDFDITETIEFPNQTLLPGLIEGHSHILLHPYNETSWNDQVLIESEAERVVNKRRSFKMALDAGVTICFGGDVGVYPHGDNVRELELMVE